MPIDTAQVATDLANILADLPVTVTYGGSPYTGRKTELRRSDVLADEGLRDEYRFSVYVRSSLLPALPAEGETVVISGTTWRILRVSQNAAESYVRLDLGEEYAT